MAPKNTSKRSPSILVTDVRNDTSKSPAPFVNRLKNVSVDSLLSGSSEVPSAVRRRERPAPARAKLPPRLTTQIPSRSSKNSQRLVMIPTDDLDVDQLKEPLSAQDREELPRCTSYCVAEGFKLDQISGFLRRRHHARTRLYDELLFVDYLLPLVPGEAPSGRVQSSPGDSQTIERMITASEQVDHHFEFFSSEDRDTTSNNDEEFDPSEPQEFSPRQYTNEHLAGQEDHQNHRRNKGSNIDRKFQRMRDQLRHAELFVLQYGVVVFWNFSEAQEKAIIADLTLNQPFVSKPSNDQDIEIEEFSFRYVEEHDPDADISRPQVYNDVITLTSPSHMFKLAMSHAIAQSTKLSRFEDRMQSTMKDVKYVPKTLALTGTLGLGREEVLKMSGKLFKLRVDVNLSSDVLDTPDIFWDSEPSLNPLYAAIRQYLEIDQRILVINERCLVFLQMTEILADSIAEYNMDRITIIVIALIVLSIFVSLVEIAVRFMVVGKGRH